MSLEYRLDRGLGDVLLVGAALQDQGLKCKLQTDNILAPVFQNHPIIEIGECKNPFVFKWPSEYHQNIWALHTMQRFSLQINRYTDPTDVLKIYNTDGSQKICSKKEKIICINQHSAEYNRRYIPDHYLQFIHFVLPSDYKVVWIGSNRNGQESITDIHEIMNVLEVCSLFIGPVSFCYHLASCLHVPSLLFTGYMPAHKFSHFFNTESISSNALCQYKCEINKQCHTECSALTYDSREISYKLNKLLD